jgi:hypothetical protein
MGAPRSAPPTRPARFAADDKRIKLPVISWVRMREAVRFSGPLKRATVSFEGGRWFVNLMVETDDMQPIAQPEAVVDVDLGERAGDVDNGRPDRAIP